MQHDQIINLYIYNQSLNGLVYSYISMPAYNM